MLFSFDQFALQSQGMEFAHLVVAISRWIKLLGFEISNPTVRGHTSARIFQVAVKNAQEDQEHYRSPLASLGLLGFWNGCDNSAVHFSANMLLVHGFAAHKEELAAVRSKSALLYSIRPQIEKYHLCAKSCSGWQASKIDTFCSPYACMGLWYTFQSRNLK
jgi:hypothetical protein